MPKYEGENAGKYGTGLYYKACLYSNSPEWIPGNVPKANGSLIAAICINKAAKQVDVAVDSSEGSVLLQTALIQVGLGFAKLNIPPAEQRGYQVLYQTSSGTRFMPTISRLQNPGAKRGLWEIISSLFKK